MLSLIALAVMQLDSKQIQERTVFQTGRPYSDRINLRADVAIVYGIDDKMPERIRTWKEKGYRIHLMTGVAWGEYQDYVYGRYDGVNHEDEAQTQKNGEKIGHGRDVWYMSPGINYGKFLASGVQKALDAGVEAVHLEEPEFWERGGYGNGFKKEWLDYYKEPWQAPDSSPDARWRAAKLMYFLYRRALQQVFDHIQAFNKRTGKHVRCYVPTHSLINYAHWGIVSPESSLARLNGCDGYIAQVWTGTARTPNVYNNVKKERTFETALMEYGSMQNLVRSTGRGVWYLADPIEDDANHDWGDYIRNYHSTLVASLLQPDVWQYEVMPWPERIFNDKYPSQENPKERVGIPDAYESELQVVINALKDMKQDTTEWISGTRGVGVAVSDSLMFQRGNPAPSDGDMSHFYGLAMPFVKRGMPVQPMQLENVTLPGYLDGLKVLLMSYEGQKPLGPEVHEPIAKWVKSGGTLVFVDDDADPFLHVREWWNTGKKVYSTPRQHLFEALGIEGKSADGVMKVGSGRVLFLRRSPTRIARDAYGSAWLYDQVRSATKDVSWKTSGAIGLRRGPYVIAAGLDETEIPTTPFTGRFVDLFDPELKVQTSVPVTANSRFFLVDLKRFKRTVVAASGQVLNEKSGRGTWTAPMEGIANTPGIVLLKGVSNPKSATLDGEPIKDMKYDATEKLLWLRFENQPKPQKIALKF